MRLRISKHHDIVNILTRGRTALVRPPLRCTAFAVFVFNAFADFAALSIKVVSFLVNHSILLLDNESGTARTFSWAYSPGFP